MIIVLYYDHDHGEMSLIVMVNQQLTKYCDDEHGEMRFMVMMVTSSTTRYYHDD